MINYETGIWNYPTWMRTRGKWLDNNEETRHINEAVGLRPLVVITACLLTTVEVAIRKFQILKSIPVIV